MLSVCQRVSLSVHQLHSLNLSLALSHHSTSSTVLLQGFLSKVSSINITVGLCLETMDKNLANQDIMT